MSRKVKVKDLKAGDVLSSGAEILSFPVRLPHAIHGKNKILVNVRYSNGNEKTQVWGKETTVTLK